MEKRKENTEWKATDSATVDTKQKDDIGVRNQTTQKSSGRFPLTTIIIIVISILIIGFFMLFVSGMVN